MAESKLLGYKKVFGLVLPDWVSEKTVKNTVYGLLVMAAMLLVLIFVVWPKLALVESRQAGLNSSKTALEALKKSKTSIDRLTADLSETDQARILSAIPQEYSPEGAIYDLRKISADTGVSILSYTLPSGVLLDTAGSVGKTNEGEMVGFVAFPVRITVSAQVESLLRFISMVESSLPFGTVSDLNIQEVTKLSRATSDKTVQMVLEVRFFQSVLKKVNISKLQAFTEDDLKLVAELRSYNLLTVPEIQPGQQIAAPVVGSGKIFGF